MKPIKQTKVGEDGNCFQAVIASMLELGLDDVPDFCNLYSTFDKWFGKCNNWLSKFGLGIVALTVETKNDYEIIGDNQNYKGCLIADLKQQHMPYDHVVIIKNGKLVHDPMPGTNKYKLPFNAFFIVVDDIKKLSGFLKGRG